MSEASSLSSYPPRRVRFWCLPCLCRMPSNRKKRKGKQKRKPVRQHPQGENVTQTSAISGLLEAPQMSEGITGKDEAVARVLDQNGAAGNPPADHQSPAASTEESPKGKAEQSGDITDDDFQDACCDIKQFPAMCKSPVKQPETNSNNRHVDVVFYGIQGSNNSCYMDSTLVSMFLCHQKFVSILNQNEDAIDDRDVARVRQILKERIVVPLYKDKRLDLSCGAMRTFRSALSKFNRRYIGNEMDPEELITTLFGSLLRVKSFYFIEGDDCGQVFQTYADPSIHGSFFVDVQTLVEYSFENSEVKLDCIPDPGFIVKLPVTNGTHMFRKIHTNLILDMRQLLALNQDTDISGCDDTKMLLSAVICLSGNHFTAFVKTSEDVYAPWLYLDSFGWRSGTTLPELGFVLDDSSTTEFKRKNNKKSNCNGSNSFLVNFLQNTAYMCFYLPMPSESTV